MESKKIKLDNDYNFIEKVQTPSYQDHIGEVFELVEQATKEKLLSDQEASILLNLAIKHEMRKDLSFVFKNQQPEKLTMFLHFKNTHQLINA